MRTLVPALLLLAGVAAWWFASHADPPTPASTSGPTAPRELGAYAGVETCRGCHAKETRAWEASPHGRHATAVAEPAGGASGAVGSRWMQAYIRRDERGYHRIMPRCFDLRTKTWRPVTGVLEEIRGAEPGAPAITDAAVAARSFEMDCSGCHASGVRLRLDVEHGRMESSWRDLAIDCEACHGPGRAHSEAWARLDASAPLTRLGTLSPQAQTGLCARCHGGPPAIGDYAPADSEHFVGVITESARVRADGSAHGQLYQYAGFGRSPCHTIGGLTCTGCHDAHGDGMREGARVNDLCVRCHEGQAGRAHAHHDADKPGGRCVDCHMPPLLEGLTSHQRDHRIGIPLPASPHVPDACSSCHQKLEARQGKAWAAQAWRRLWGEPPAATLEAIDAVQRARRAAHGEADGDAAPALRRALSHSDPYFRVAAAHWLDDPASVASDPAPAVRLAAVRIARRLGARDVLGDLRKDASLRVRAEAFTSLVELGGDGITGDGAAEAPPSVEGLELAVRQVRDAVAVYVALGETALRDGRPADAVRHLEQAVVFDPSGAATWRALAPAYEAVGRRKAALAAWARAGVLDEHGTEDGR